MVNPVYKTYLADVVQFNWFQSHFDYHKELIEIVTMIIDDYRARWMARWVLIDH